MFPRIAAKITGVAGYVPPKVMTNADLEKIGRNERRMDPARAPASGTPRRGEGHGHSHMATEAPRLCWRNQDGPYGDRPDRACQRYPGMFSPPPPAWYRNALARRRVGLWTCPRRALASPTR